MVHLLQRHAFSIKARLAASLVLAYALPADALQPLLAPGLELDTFGDVGFLAIALVETRSLRPAALPAASASASSWPATASSPATEPPPAAPFAAFASFAATPIADP